MPSKRADALIEGVRYRDTCACKVVLRFYKGTPSSTTPHKQEQVLYRRAASPWQISTD